MEKSRNKKKTIIVVCGVGLLCVVAGLLAGHFLKSTGTPMQTQGVVEAEKDAGTKLLTSTTVDDSGAITESDEYTYDEQGRCTKMESYDDTHVVISYDVYSFDAKGQVTEDAFYNPDDTISSRQVYEYDDAGNKTLDTTYSSADGVKADEVEMVTTYAYDASNQLISEVYTEPDQTVDYRYTYQYNQDGEMVASSMEDMGNSVTNYIYTYEYDESHNCLRKTIKDEDGSIQEDHKYLYDTLGNLIQDTVYDESGEIVYYITNTY